MKRGLIILSSLVFLASVTAASAEMTTIYGPVYVTKAEHKKHDGGESKFTFTAPVPGSGVIVVKNGGASGEKKTRAASAEIELNGVEVADEDDFNKNTTELRYDVELLSSNEMEVEVKSCKKCELEITVLGEKAATPTAPPDRPTRPAF